LNDGDHQPQPAERRINTTHLHPTTAMAHPNFLLNSRALVIGGSSEIGFAVASGALSNGSKVHITSSTAEKLSTKIKQLQSLYPDAHVSGNAADLSPTRRRWKYISCLS
jgi:short-subunit dehydrogenase